jgi:hypothetical protein
MRDAATARADGALSWRCEDDGRRAGRTARRSRSDARRASPMHDRMAGPGRSNPRRAPTWI